AYIFTGSGIGGTGGLTKSSTNTVTLANSSNTYAGSTLINAGTLVATGGIEIPDASAVTISAGAQLTINQAETIGSLAGSGGVQILSGSLTTGGNNLSTTFS